MNLTVRYISRSRIECFFSGLFIAAVCQLFICTPSYADQNGTRVEQQSSMNEDSQSKEVNIIWFGHSLLKFDRPPPIDIAKLVAELHELARHAGRTNLVYGKNRAHAEGPYHFEYWLDGVGDAAEKLVAEDVKWDYVIGIGFMHLQGQRKYDWPNVYHFLSQFNAKKYRNPRTFTALKYRFIHLVNQSSPNATWVNYVGPALANNTGPQDSIDERFECIRQTAESAGVKVVNAPVGRAFRNAEATMQERIGKRIRLQQEKDNLHLTEAGALLSASVLYHTIFGVDIVGLPVPPTYAGVLDESQVVPFLYSMASETIKTYSPECRTDAKYTEDEEGQRLLKSL